MNKLFLFATAATLALSGVAEAGSRFPDTPWRPHERACVQEVEKLPGMAPTGSIYNDFYVVRCVVNKYPPARGVTEDQQQQCRDTVYRAVAGLSYADYETTDLMMACLRVR